MNHPLDSTPTSYRSFGPYKPQFIIVDFEKAIHNAIDTVWPSSTKRGCNFHFNKDVFRNLKKSDCYSEYLIQGSEIRKLVSMCTDIAFIPESDVDQAWSFIRPLIPVDMENFRDFFERTWIGTSSTPPIFSHDMWNQYDATLMLLPRTTNIAKGCNHSFHTLVACDHPTIWRLLDCVNKEQNLSDAKNVYQATDGGET